MTKAFLLCCTFFIIIGFIPGPGPGGPATIGSQVVLMGPSTIGRPAQ